MECRQLIIKEKHRQYHGFLASLKDYSYCDGGSVEADLVVNHPHISLLCLDHQQRLAVFVETHPLDLAKAPFMCRAQFEHAKRIITVPYPLFNQLADNLPSIRRPIFVHTTGRSGSTLLHHAFNHSGAVVSLSEPDTPAQFVKLRNQAGPQDLEELPELAENSLKFLFKNHHQPGVLAHAVKFRPRSVPAMDFFQSVFPQAKNIFLHRQARNFVASAHRVSQQFEEDFCLFQQWQADHELYWGTDLGNLGQYLGESNPLLSLVERLTLRWMTVMEWYLTQMKTGLPSLAMDFKNLVGAPAEALKEIFDHCLLPQKLVADSMSAFKRDSQYNTPLRRENPEFPNQRGLTESQLNAMEAILSGHPVLRASNFNPENIVGA